MPVTKVYADLYPDSNVTPPQPKQKRPAFDPSMLEDAIKHPKIGVTEYCADFDTEFLESIKNCYIDCNDPLLREREAIAVDLHRLAYRVGANTSITTKMLRKILKQSHEIRTSKEHVVSTLYHTRQDVYDFIARIRPILTITEANSLLGFYITSQSYMNLMCQEKCAHRIGRNRHMLRLLADKYKPVCFIDPTEYAENDPIFKSKLLINTAYLPYYLNIIDAIALLKY